jgi:UDP-2,3-diacylglucosamine pyrophosphatase LpxH
MSQRKLVYRSVFLSDLHLGSAGSQADRITRLLAHVECDNLYLVGDIIDAWVGGRAIRWRKSHETALLALLNQTQPRCRVRYTPGNHDAVMRRFIGIRLFTLEIENTFDHVTPDGRTFLVIHGDGFDKFVTTYKPFAWTLAWMYEMLSRANDAVNRIRVGTGRAPTDFSKRLKKRVKHLTERFTHFEEQLTTYAREHGYEGVVCGHVHKPALHSAENGLSYVNTGDWVENCTYVVEHYNGEFELIRWDDIEIEVNRLEKLRELSKERPPTSPAE